jgi:hypothetical protein
VEAVRVRLEREAKAVRRGVLEAPLAGRLDLLNRVGMRGLQWIQRPMGWTGIARVWLDGSLIIDKTDIGWSLQGSDFYWAEVAWADQRAPSDYGLPAGGQYRDTDHLEVFWSKTRE